MLSGLSSPLIIALLAIFLGLSIGLILRGILISTGREIKPVQVTNKQVIIFAVVWFFLCILFLPVLFCGSTLITMIGNK